MTVSAYIRVLSLGEPPRRRPGALTREAIHQLARFATTHGHLPSTLELAEVLARKLTPEQPQALSAIEQFRTAALGGHLERCDRCDHEVPACCTPGPRSSSSTPTSTA